MAQIPMYQGMVNSPQTELTTAIDDTQITIDVQNGDSLPDAPNLAVIIGGELSETILYTEKTGNTLSGITRGFQGEARGWSLGTKIARNGTEYDHRSVKENIEDLQEQIEGITPASIGAETPTGAQAKADAAQTAAEQSAQTLVNDLQTDVNQLDSDLTTHTATQVHSAEAHGMRVNPTTLDLEYFNGTTWVTVSTDIGDNVITATTSDINYYVDAVSGNDSNDGSSGSPFKTIMHAVNLIPKYLKHYATITVTGGTYAEDVVISGFLGGGRIVLTTTGAVSQGSHNVKSISIINCKDATLSNLTITGVNSSNWGVDVMATDHVYINNLKSVATKVGGIRVMYGSTAYVINCVISNTSTALYSERGSSVVSQGNSGTGNSTGLSAFAGIIYKNGAGHPSGTTAESKGAGGQIF